MRTALDGGAITGNRTSRRSPRMLFADPDCSFAKGFVESSFFEDIPEHGQHDM